jgi:26S proteasome regulatory subunit T6
MEIKIMEKRNNLRRLEA